MSVVLRSALGTLSARGLVSMRSAVKGEKPRITGFPSSVMSSPIPQLGQVW